MKNILFLFTLIIVFSTCRDVHTYNGSSKIVKTSSDLSLKDSSLIFGYVRSADGNVAERSAIIWIEGTNISTKSDSEGYFGMHLIPGTYTLSCKREFEDDKWTETLKNLNLKLNERTEVEFILGIKVE